MMQKQTMALALGFLVALASAAPRLAPAEVCTTQSQMKPADRDSLAAAAVTLASLVQTGDTAALRTLTVANLAKDFSGVEGVVANTAPKLKDATLTVDQVYILEASELKRNADGSNPDVQFFCSLNKTAAEVDFLIPQLPPGRYGFAIVQSKSATPWRLSFLVRQEQGKWAMAGFYPSPTSAAGHDGVWYWTEARKMVKSKEQWNAWLYYQQAASLLQPAPFVQSTHLEKLHTESAAAAPPALSDGISTDAPLVVKGADGVEYHFTALGTNDSLGKEKLDVVAHLKVETMGDPVAARKRSTEAMIALLAVYPELRKAFRGVWMVTDTTGQSPFVIISAMTEIH
jgi:hypothetical protein